VLVAEDQEEVRKLTKRVLEARGYTVLAARNGAEALEIVAQHPNQIHLMITDVVMPGMNGREVAQLACARRSDLKVLFVSGYTGEAVLQHRLLEPGVAFLQKPFTPDVLARKTRELLDDGRSYDATDMTASISAEFLALHELLAGRYSIERELGRGG